MSFSQDQVDEAFAALGLEPPGAAELTAIESINGPIVFVDYSQSGQQFEFPCASGDPDHRGVAGSASPGRARRSDVRCGARPFPRRPDTRRHGQVGPDREPQLASAISVSSQAFASVNNGGVLLDPNAAVSDSLVEALFVRDLGHTPSAATVAGFNGMTNAQAFLAFATSDAVSQTLATNVQGYLMDAIAGPRTGVVAD